MTNAIGGLTRTLVKFVKLPCGSWVRADLIEAIEMHELFMITRTKDETEYETGFTSTEDVQSAMDKLAWQINEILSTK